MTKLNFIKLYFYSTLIIFILPLLFFSCEKKQDTSSVLNGIIYDKMKNAYLWYDKIPTVNPDNYDKPEDFLDAIIYKQIDHWSFIKPKSEYIKEFKEGKFYGHGFSYGLDNEGILRIAYVFKNSDLYSAGVRRGWIMKLVNDVVPDTSNIKNLLGSNTEGLKNKFMFERPDRKDTTLTFSKKELTMNMVLYRDTFHVDNKIVGFIVFKGFMADAQNELNEAFAYFKQTNVNELILDLRYNTGGDLGITDKLAGMLAGQTANNQKFITLTYNNKNQSSNEDHFIKSSENSLNITRLFTICTKLTASASEAIINGLRPYMDVKIIGDDTYGKPTGMNVWELKGYDYVFAPVTFKITNKNGEGDYYNGIPADVKAFDDITHDFGDPQEECTAQALNYIRNSSFLTTRKSAIQNKYIHHWTGWELQIGAY